MLYGLNFGNNGNLHFSGVCPQCKRAYQCYIEREAPEDNGHIWYECCDITAEREGLRVDVQPLPDHPRSHLNSYSVEGGW